MLDFIRVETPKFFPFNCRACQSGKDLIDTHAEDHVGRVYLCRMCIERGARVFGMIEGNRHQELMQADTSLLRAEKGLEQKDEQVRELLDHVERLEAMYRESEETGANLRQRNEQLESAIRAQAEADLALVGSVAVAGTTTVTFPREEQHGNGSENSNEAEDTANHPAEDHHQEGRSNEGGPED